eukprot:CAMPEP_0171261798 /NCGR_PEP_ID=MMETSP0790-20130122/56199_1 /TAXON_ID=2925 /ORGANISM="Alexandrium catenella, Strain OF101" /LENGTH=222 /DNA_ID=CAMNT_0011730255 /DNA_START=24 /DNA_END=690 /DNA_ORIENTATION=-
MAHELRPSFPSDAKTPGSSPWVPRCPRRPLTMLSRLAPQPGGSGGNPLERKLVLAGAAQFPSSFPFTEAEEAAPSSAGHKALAARQTSRMLSRPGNACSAAKFLVEGNWSTGRRASDVSPERGGDGGASDSPPGSPTGRAAAMDQAGEDYARTPVARSASTGTLGLQSGASPASQAEDLESRRSFPVFAGGRSPQHWRRVLQRPAQAGGNYSNRIRALQYMY